MAGHSCQDLDAFIEGDERSVCHTACKRGPGAPLSVDSEVDNILLDRWRKMCTVLKSSCSSLSRLTLICDYKDLRTALEVTEPLKQAPKLDSCSIRLG